MTIDSGSSWNEIEMALAERIRVVVLERGDGPDDGGEERRAERDAGDEAFPCFLAEQSVQQETCKRQQRDEPESVQHFTEC
jgi:hypothetical protein